jgi:predicted Zn-dependent protease
VNTSTVDQDVRIARELIRRGRLPEAEALALRLSHASPGVPSTLLACEIEEARPDLTRALDIVTTALARDGEHPALHLKRAQILMALRRRSDGFAAAERAIEIAEPEPDPLLLDAVASIYMQTNEPGRAKPLLYRVLARSPNDPTLLYKAALSHFYLNETAEADALLARVLEMAPGYGFAWHIRSQLATQTLAANHISELRSALARPRLRDVDRMLVSFALAKELEDVGEFAQSFDTLLQPSGQSHQTGDADV